MSFNKKYITKESVLNALTTGKSLSKLTNADSLIMDSWSSGFFENYKFDNYKTLRQEIISDNEFSSILKSTEDHKNFSKLKSLPNILENLYLNPEWVDILLTLDILGSDHVEKSSQGRFDRLKAICIKKIENHFDGH